MRTVEVDRKAQVLTGAEAVAHAMRQIDPDVVPVYPITPQTPIAEVFAQFVADGRCDTEIINVESEHSAMSAAVGASLAGARVMTATGSQGLALMLEIVYIAASLRAPIVIAIGSRALSGPINIHCDHSDSMAARDSGVVQLFAENAQEAYDHIIIAQKLAENVLLPVMVMQDGFTITHSAEPVALVDDQQVRRFVGEHQPRAALLDVEHPTTQGAFAMPDYYFEHKLQQVEAIERVFELLPEIQHAYAGISGRQYQGSFEAYALEDADRVVIVLGSTAGTAREAVDRLRRDGERVGVLKLRLFRPFPRAEIATALQGRTAVAILDRSLSFGSAGPLFLEVSSALYDLPQMPRLYNYTYGLGGRDITPEQIMAVFEELQDETLASALGPELNMRYIGSRE